MFNLEEIGENVTNYGHLNNQAYIVRYRQLSLHSKVQATADKID